MASLTFLFSKYVNNIQQLNIKKIHKIYCLIVISVFTVNFIFQLNLITLIIPNFFIKVIYIYIRIEINIYNDSSLHQKFISLFNLWSYVHMPDVKLALSISKSQFQLLLFCK
jgi:hypothetical protein